MKKPTLTRLLRFLAPPLALLALTFAAYPYLFTQFSTAVPLGDTPDVLYIMSVIQHTILAPVSQVYHLPFYYPRAYTLTYGHPLFGLSVLFKVFAWLGLSVTQSYNLYIILALILGCWGSYLLAVEVTGRTVLSLACACLPLFWAGNRIHFININFLSWFASAFIFLFLIRFFRSGRMHHALFAGLASFYLFFTEIYFGLHMWVFLLPAFLVTALALRLLNGRQLVTVLAVLACATLLVFVVYFPFLTQARAENLSRPFDETMLLQPRSLFMGNTLLLALMGQPHGGSHAFPGMVAAAALLAFLTSRLPRWRHLSLGLALVLLLTCSYLQLVNLFALDLLFFFTLILLVFFAAFAWPRLESVEKAMLVTVALLFGVMTHFPGLPLLKRFIPYGWFFKIVPGMNGLRAVGRVFFPVSMPLLTTLAASGICHQLDMRIKKEPARETGRRFLHMALPVLIASGIYLENVTLKYPIQPLPSPSPIYFRLPRGRRSIIFEYPWDYVYQKYYVNGLYMMAWRWHRQPMLNGRSAFFPDNYISGLYSFLGFDLAAFPQESQLQRLAEDYGVSHVIIHWDLLVRLYGDQPNLSRVIRERLYCIGRWARVSFQSSQGTILKVMERFPVSRMIRTYAGYDLGTLIVEVRVQEPMPGNVNLLINSSPGPEPDLVGEMLMRWDLRRMNLRPDGNRLEWTFGTPVKVSAVQLVPPEKK